MSSISGRAHVTVQKRVKSFAHVRPLTDPLLPSHQSQRLFTLCGAYRRWEIGHWYKRGLGRLHVRQKPHYSFSRFVPSYWVQRHQECENPPFPVCDHTLSGSWWEEMLLADWRSIPFRGVYPNHLCTRRPSLSAILLQRIAPSHLYMKPCERPHRRAPRTR